MDALTHAIEAYVSTMANPLTDAAALKPQMITQYCRKQLLTVIMAVPEIIWPMRNIWPVLPSFNNASLGYVHAMAHQLGGL
jgi:alcohol dehydrogenase